MVGIGLVALAVAAVVVVVVLRLTRDKDARRTRFGVFAERDRFDEDALERGWDEDDTIEIEPLRYQKKYPPEEDK